MLISSVMQKCRSLTQPNQSETMNQVYERRLHRVPSEFRPGTAVGLSRFKAMERLRRQGVYLGRVQGLRLVAVGCQLEDRVRRPAFEAFVVAEWHA